MPGLIDIAGLRKEYPMRGGAVQALRGVTLSVQAGEYIAIVGASGSGKSTLLYLLGMLVTPTAGQYRFDGKEVQTLSDVERSRLRGREIGFVFQSFHLLPQFTVLENVLLASRYCPPAREDPSRRALQLLERVGLSHRLEHHPAELSNGEMQRVAIARALLTDPRLLLADEPTGNLDERTGNEITALLEELNREGKTVILITHNPALAGRAARRIAIKDGQVAA